MKKLLALTLLSMFAGLALCTGAHAADAATATTTTPQQEKMKSCNASAADKKGDDRKAYMQSCLSAKPPAKPQSKMAMCNSKTKGMAKADADKARSECMKAS